MTLHEAIAARIAAARASGTPIAPFRDTHPELGAADAYAIQDINTARRRAAGGYTVGRKIGLTSAAVQTQLGVDEPDSGWLWADRAFTSGATITDTRLMAPRVEAEIALVLASDLNDGENLADAVAYAVPALEIVDSAIRDWDIGLVDTVGDNASGWGFVLGGPETAITGLALAEMEMTLSRDGTIESQGRGSATMGSPLNALAWLARHASARGYPLKAGEVIMSGALGPVLAARRGNRFEARIGSFAPVSVSFDTSD
ncbi:MAG: fumarylacetoacetate hydrolase family protein [Candidatus Sphingomonas colombiensis]|nr:fumarylacetoacetate hydrolase family protein [Sphingomonas sp.]WEK44833.1 MAG: fumarylacetoacetate hydrolase family protein [Sphingomonas sp.]